MTGFGLACFSMGVALTNFFFVEDAKTRTILAVVVISLSTIGAILAYVENTR